MGKSRVSWSREERAAAKAKAKALFAMAFDAPHGEALTYIGVGDETLRADVEALILHHLDRETGKVTGSAFHAAEERGGLWIVEALANNEMHEPGAESVRHVCEAARTKGGAGQRAGASDDGTTKPRRDAGS